MAHPCINCGSECYCNGDIDDIIVSKTPRSCEGSGCVELLSEDDLPYDDYFEDEPSAEDMGIL